MNQSRTCDVVNFLSPAYICVCWAFETKHMAPTKAHPHNMQLSPASLARWVLGSLALCTAGPSVLSLELVSCHLAGWQQSISETSLLLSPGWQQSVSGTSLPFVTWLAAVYLRNESPSVTWPAAGTGLCQGCLFGVPTHGQTRTAKTPGGGGGGGWERGGGEEKKRGGGEERRRRRHTYN